MTSLDWNLKCGIAVSTCSASLDLGFIYNLIDFLEDHKRCEQKWMQGQSWKNLVTWFGASLFLGNDLGNAMQVCKTKWTAIKKLKYFSVKTPGLRFHRFVHSGRSARRHTCPPFFPFRSFLRRRGDYGSRVRLAAVFSPPLHHTTLLPGPTEHVQNSLLPLLLVCNCQYKEEKWPLSPVKASPHF